MEMLLRQPKPPDVSAEQRASNELVKPIRKLRWMGMEKEAVSAQMQLVRCRVPLRRTCLRRRTIRTNAEGVETCPTRGRLRWASG